MSIPWNCSASLKGGDPLKNKSSLLIPVVLLLLFLPGMALADEEASQEAATISEKLLNAKEAAKGEAGESIIGEIKGRTETLEKGDAVDQVVKKSGELGEKFWLMAQAQTWPLFIYGVAIGLGLLFFGFILNIRVMRRSGGWLIVFAFLQLVVINYAPEIAEGLITKAGRIAGGS
jgi:hypothetical protein